MNPFLLHARLSASGPTTTLVVPAGWDGMTYESIDAVLNTTAEAMAEFTIEPGGTWFAVTNGGTEGGNWISDPATGVGAGYEVRFTVVASLGGTATVVNGASTFVSLSASRSFSLMVTQTTSGARSAMRQVRVDIRPTGGDFVNVGTFTLFTRAENGS